jgi:Domain of unknown function (DUF4333)
VSTGSPRKRGRWVPGLIALAALLLIGVVFGAGADLTHPGPKSLSGRDVADQIALGVQADKGWSQPPQVHCPASEPAKPGVAFRCTMVGPHTGGTVSVEVTEIDSRGHLRWSLSPP